MQLKPLQKQSQQRLRKLLPLPSKNQGIKKAGWQKPSCFFKYRRFKDQKILGCLHSIRLTCFFFQQALNALATLPADSARTGTLH
jgi:hypothetical protein